MSGYHPLIPVLRKLGIRTRGEIDREMFALMVLRGDCNNIPVERPSGPVPAAEVLRAVNA